MSLDDTMDVSGMIGVNGHSLDSKGRRFWAVIDRQLGKWDIHLPPPAERLPEKPVPLSEVEHLIEKPRLSTSVDASVDAKNPSVDYSQKAQLDALQMMLEKGYTLEQIRGVLEALGKKSTDASTDEDERRQTREALATISRRRERDKKYQSERRKKLKENEPASVDASPAYISSLPLEENTKKERVDSGIHAREAFEKLWRVYPKRLGSNPRKPAQDQFNILVKNGHDPDRIVSGAQGYFDEAKRTNIVGTPYVMQAVKFLRQQIFNDYQRAPDRPAENTKIPPWERMGITQDEWRKQREAELNGSSGREVQGPSAPRDNGEKLL